MNDISKPKQRKQSNEKQLRNAKGSLLTLISGMSEEQVERIISLTGVRRCEPGETVIQDEQPADAMFYLLSGNLNVDKAVQGEHCTINFLTAGDWFGEVGILDNQVRTATVIAHEASEILVLQRNALDELKDTDSDAYNLFIRTIASSLCLRMRQASDNLVKQNTELKKASQMRLVMGTYICLTVLVLSSYSVLLSIGQSLIDGSTTTSMVTSPLMLLLAGTMLWLMKRSGYPLSSYGLSMRGAWQNTIQAAVWTIPLLVLITGLKWLGIQLIDSWAGRPLFIFDTILSGNLVPGRHTPLWQAALMGFTYSLTVPVQEFIIRGAFQTPLVRFLTGSYALPLAILIANTMFTTVHLHMSPTFAIAAFFPGLFWGWLYARQGTLVGPCVSHAIIGLWALYAMGIRDLF